MRGRKGRDVREWMTSGKSEESEKRGGEEGGKGGSG